MIPISIRVDDFEELNHDKLMEFTAWLVETAQPSEYIMCHETYSPQKKIECKPHYHIWVVATERKENAIRLNLLRYMPELKRQGSKGSPRYSMTTWKGSDKDMANARQYHCKGRAKGQYNIIMSNFDDDTIQEFNNLYWEQTNQKKKSSGFVKGRTLNDLYSYLDNNEQSIVIQRYGKKKVDTQKLFCAIIDFYEGGIMFNHLELRMQQCMYRYSAADTKKMLMERYTRWNNFTEINFSPIDKYGKTSLGEKEEEHPFEEIDYHSDTDDIIEHA